MGLPVAASARAMMVNMDLNEKAGATPPKTWDELYEALKKIAALPETFAFGVQGKEIETDAYYYYSLWTQGGDILKADSTSGLDTPEAPDLKYQILPFPEGKAKATYGVTDRLIMFADSDAKDAAWKFIEFAYKDEWREKFDMGEGFLPVTKKAAALPYVTDDPDVAGFAAGLPYAKFAPTIANREEIADVTVRTMPQIYPGEVTPED